MNISFLTSGHYPFDDRIYYHMARSLYDKNNNVEIISSKCDLRGVEDGIKINCFEGENLTKREKIASFVKQLSFSAPDTIICCEPLTVLAAKKYSSKLSVNIKIVYDVTEWYPAKKNLAPCKFPFRWILFLKLLFFNLWVTRFADSFIFGEWYKSKPYRILYPGKPFIFVPYFPDLKYINYADHILQKGKLRLSYSGRICLDKGYKNFFEAVQKLTELDKDLKIDITFISWYESSGDEQECNKYLSSLNPNVSISIFNKQSYRNFIELIKDTDIFLDLRSDDFENQYCLPIKLFYYTALGRPVIFSDLKAIRKEVEISKFGFLVKPYDNESIAQIIYNYLNNTDFYYSHCRNARSLAENKYNWASLESGFIEFISS
jgi:glycosyltransferase involved in cell wall biosynthesis